MKTRAQESTNRTKMNPGSFGQSLIGSILTLFTLSPEPPHFQPAHATATIALNRSQAMTRSQLTLQLGGSRSGRVVLHAFCLLRHPERANWHWRGILREFHG